MNRGTLKGIRSGLFFSNPPITRIVLDLTGPQAYQILSAGNSTIVKFAKNGAEEPSPGASQQSAKSPKGRGARFTDATLTSHPAHLSQAAGISSPGRSFSEAQLSTAQPSSRQASAVYIGNAAGVSSDQPSQTAALEPAIPAQPQQPSPLAVSVTYDHGMLSIHSDKATLSQVLYEVHLRTQAEIAIPAGAEQEKVVAESGSGSRA